MKIVELKDKLEEIERTERCIELDNVSRLKYKGPSGKGFTFTLADAELNFEGKELALLCQNVDVNLPFTRKCSDPLKETLFTEFLSRPGKSLKLVARENQVTGVLPFRTPYVPSSKLVDVVATAIEAVDVEYKNYNGTRIFDFVSKINAEPKKRVGDVTKAGITLLENRSNVLTSYEVNVGGFLYRLSCSNGAVTRTESLHRIGGKTVEEILNGVGNTTRKVFEVVSKEDLLQFVHLDDVKAEDPSNLVHRLSRDSRIPASLERRILDRIPELGLNPTMYDVINLVTSVANDEKLSIRNSRLLQVMGGQLTISAEHRCPTCKVILN